ncbi:MAG: peptidoglycan-binding protein [bacterium]|nr:peptidoglycan-binding protein [bacterium]
MRRRIKSVKWRHGRTAHLLLGAALIVAGGIAATLYSGLGSDRTDNPRLQSALKSTAVARRDLAQYLEISGTLDYAVTGNLTARSNGVLGELALEGALVKRGDPLYVVLSHPTAAQITEAQQRLESALNRLLDAEEQLRARLAGASVAQIATARARVAQAIERRAELLEPTDTASIHAAEAAVLAARQALDGLQNPTPAKLADARTRLARAEHHLAVLNTEPDRHLGLPQEVQGTQADVETAEAAVLTAQESLDDLLNPVSQEELTALEQAVATAQAALDNAHRGEAELAHSWQALVVMYGNKPMYRTMSLGDEGPDVRQLEENLAELGFANISGFSIDGSYDEATSNAVRAWQSSIGTYVDGEVGRADVLFVPGPLRVNSWHPGVQVGQDVVAGTQLASFVVTERQIDGTMASTERVIALLPLSERDLLNDGDPVNVKFPDSSDITGTVTSINPTPHTDGKGGVFVEITITFLERAPAVWIGAAVDVEIVKTLVQDAFVVPATALLALSEGGYAVEVLRHDGTTELIGVETGLFSNGDVEVRGIGLEEGIGVVIPR